MEERYDLDQTLDRVEGNAYNNATTGSEYEISVKNENSNGKVRLLVYPENTLNQVFKDTAKDIGLDVNEKNNLFINENNETTSNGNTTLIGFGVKENSLLRIAPDGVVAAGVPCKPIGKFEDYKAKLME